MPYIFLITGFWKKGNGYGTKSFKFNPWKKNLNDQDHQSYHKNIKNSFLKYCSVPKNRLYVQYIHNLIKNLFDFALVRLK